MELLEKLDTVSDADSFLVFARALYLDRKKSIQAETEIKTSIYGADVGGWENTSIDAFLEAAIAWAEDSHFGSNQGLTPENPWKQFAVFLYCGRIYE